MSAAPFVSVSCWGGRGLGACLAQLGQLGVREVELSVGAPAEAGSAAALESLRADGWRFLAHHQVSVHPGQRPRLDLCRGLDGPWFEALFDLCDRLGIGVYTMHTGKVRPGEDPAEAEGHFWRRLDELRRMAARWGVRLGLETMFPSPPGRPRHLFDDAAGLERLLRRIEGSELGLVADAAHLKIGLRRGAWGRDLVQAAWTHPSVVELHLSENDGLRDQHRPIREESWFWPLLEAADPALPVVLEGRPGPQGLAGIQRQIELVRRRR